MEGRREGREEYKGREGLGKSIRGRREEGKETEI